ncbi:MAG TPA: DUF5703 domain-containing protein [Clostridia bacterium]|nr:DUF5703 domain-containing protein [Clostridia bacterium]
MKSEFTFYEPGKSDVDSFPIGNGDIGAMVWGEDNGRICFYISKTDSFSSALRLLKIGRINISIGKGFSFISQKLDITKGVTTLEYEDDSGRTQVEVWVDASNPCIRVGVISDEMISLELESEVWRNADERIEGGFDNRTAAYGDFFGQDNDDEPIIVYKDHINEKYDDAVMWYHRNPASHYMPSLRFQQMEDLAHHAEDPLMNRTFGACVVSDQLKKDRSLGMSSKAPEKHHEICIGVLTDVTDDTDGFCVRLKSLTDSCSSIDYMTSLKAHIDYWKELFTKSYISMKGDRQADLVESGYNIQRYMNACAGRGEFPIKFNGSIFVPNVLEGPDDLGPDYRRWGGGYWFQNTRLTYWSMLASGDFDMMKSFFDMYENMFELSKAKVEKHLGFKGVLYPETTSPWGTARNICYSKYRNGLNPAITGNYYVRYYFSGMLELLTIMIDFVRYTEDEAFETEVLYKHADYVLSFYRNFYSEKDENGKMVIYPSQALETWQDARNPMDAVAGLRYVLEELIKMNGAQKSLIDEWKEFYETIPELPVFSPGGHPEFKKPCLLKPADWYEKLGNVENPELYAVFPYRLVAFDKDQNMGIENYRRRSLRMNWGWTQDGIQAAVIGLPEEAQEVVVDKFTKWHEKCRFQGYWGVNFDWIADQCHGCSAMIAIQKMLIQCVDEKIYLFPAWPKEWDVEFRLFAYDNTIVEGKLVNGEVKNLKTIPEKRTKDIEICFDRQIHTLY